MTNLGVDLLGSDRSPKDLVEAVSTAYQSLQAESRLTLFAPSSLQLQLEKYGEVIPVDETISMDDDPLKAIRVKKNASMIQGLRRLKESSIDGFISCGNTGALLAASVIHLSLQEGVERPALATLIPTHQKPCLLLDLGANVKVRPETLVEFAKLGVQFTQTNLGVSKPRCALLNVGKEPTKGRKEHRTAYQLLSNQSFFIGNVEPNHVFDGDANVVVTDGFTGNIFLKSLEGASRFFLERMPEAANAVDINLFADEYPGAILLGLDQLVIKCHGRGSVASVANSITYAEKILAGK